MQTAIPIPTEKIQLFCKKWKIKEMQLFGSILRPDFNADSDIDFLIRFGEGTDYSLFDIIRAEEELANIVQRKVDLIDKRGIERSRNYIRRKKILDQAEAIYAE